jgi:heterodisulfide reductase subunit B
MTYHSNVEGSRVIRLPIYYLEVQVSYMKRKHWTPIDTWVVTTIEDENYILREDPKTKDRLFQYLYGKGYKSQKAVRIDKVHSKKEVGYTNRTYESLSESLKKKYNEAR